MKAIIYFSGVENSGKTHTLNMLIGLLDPSKKPEDLSEDRRIVVSYKGLRIAITTWGDDEKQLDENIKFCESQGKECDIWVTATKSKGATISVVKDFSRKCSCDPTKMEKNKTTKLETLINASQAQDIQAFIDKLIDGSK